MKFTDEELETIETLAACHYGPREIAVYLEVNVEKFKNLWDREQDRYTESTIRFHYEKGLLVSRAEMSIKMLESAKGGSITAIQMWQNAQREQDFKSALEV